MLNKIRNLFIFLNNPFPLCDNSSRTDNHKVSVLLFFLGRKIKTFNHFVR
ncbi:MAG: hypothetical protein ACRC8Z_07695 [Empedobacter falsenii]